MVEIACYKMSKNSEYIDIMNNIYTLYWIFIRELKHEILYRNFYCFGWIFLRSA